MLKKIIWYVILPLAVITVVYFIFFNKKGTTTDTTTQNTNTNNTQTENTDTDTNTNTSTTTTDTPLTGFSVNNQEVGTATNGAVNFTISAISNTSTTNYHEFKFTLTSEDTNSPYVTAKYIASSGVIRLSFSDVTKDEGGLGYQKAISINKEGIVQLYHNISSSFVGEIYDIGISKSTPFKLSLESGNNIWYITLDVQYPGASESTVDLGSTEFSTDAQDIAGVSKDQKATVASYSYSSSSGVLKFAWNVSSTDTNPIPSVTAAYDSSNNLVITFTSLSVDKVVSAVNGKTLPGSISVASSKTGDSSVYTFGSMSSPKEYKLSAGTSPNQVVLEIKL